MRSIVLGALMAAAAAVAQSSWIDFKSAEGQLSVSVPCQPAITSDLVPGPPAFTSSVFMCSAPGGEVYTFGWVEFEPSPDEDKSGLTLDPDVELAANRDNLLYKIGAKLLTSNTTSIDGRRTLEFTASRNNLQLVTSRVFIAGRRPYQIAVFTPLNEDHSANIRRFLASFETSAR